ncbi:hypothetical protein K505DRAFT_393292 [Melanomma pulvis-pyrius CBS 109.77]|uniref:F-box domain-containing protein n=1 Tax=Melanomma pulvis-pyrius CBS 109.77 TaxID=1314802 RepID=A0A6A6WYR9_9PLEO|nr:hypothetical protein K505DRAFT_393292 [Melanomma pulvis-pyrius CBS 109.77]
MDIIASSTQSPQTPASTLPRLPPELWGNILRLVPNRWELWQNCRQVSRAFRNDVEFLFSETVLPITTIYWRYIEREATHQCPTEVRGRFIRLSQDKSRAYFCVKPRCAYFDRQYAHTHTHDYDEFEQYFANYRTETLWQQLQLEKRYPRCWIQIGDHDINSTEFHDTELPGLAFHIPQEEISLDWKKLYAFFYREEEMLQRLQLYENPDENYWRLDLPSQSPITISVQDALSFKNRFGKGSQLRLLVRTARFQHYLRKIGQPSHEIDLLLQFKFKISLGGYDHLQYKIQREFWSTVMEMRRKAFIHWGACHNFQEALFCGTRMLVEDPAAQGYMPLPPSWHGIRWIKYMDAESSAVHWEAEDMARGWEDCLSI